MKAFSTVEEFKKIQTKNEQEYQRKIEQMTKKAKEELGKLDLTCQSDLNTKNTCLEELQNRLKDTINENGATIEAITKETKEEYQQLD